MGELSTVKAASEWLEERDATSTKLCCSESIIQVAAPSRNCCCLLSCNFGLVSSEAACICTNSLYIESIKPLCLGGALVCQEIFSTTDETGFVTSWGCITHFGTLQWSGFCISKWCNLERITRMPDLAWERWNGELSWSESWSVYKYGTKKARIHHLWS